MDQQTLTKFQYALGTRLQLRRIEAGYSQSEMAKLCNVSKTYISNIETGKTKQPASIIVDYCNILNMSANDLLNITIQDAEISSAQDLIQLLQSLDSILTEKDLVVIAELVKHLADKNLQ